MKTIEIIIPIFNEENNIVPLYEAISKETNHLAYNFKLKFIDDGSSDTSWQKVLNLSSKYNNISGIKLTRNFGHQSAIDAGIQSSVGTPLIIMDADLQDDPKYIKEFIDSWEKGAQIVLARRISRKEGIIRRITTRIFFLIQNKISDISIPKNVGHFSFLDSEVVLQLKKFPEKNKYLNGLRAYLGFEIAFVDVVKNKRYSGKSKMSYLRLLRLGLSGVFGFSTKPLNAIGVLGLIISFGSILVSLVSLVYKFKFGVNVLGWTFGLSSIYFLSGIQLLSISILGYYIGTVFKEVKSRPNFIINDSFNCE